MGFWVTTSTLFELDAVDQEEPCMIGVDYICYRYGYDQNQSGDVEGDEFHAWVCTPGTHVEFYFTEECYHRLEWYSVDLFGNKEETNVQYHKVNNTPPSIITGLTVTDAKDGKLNIEWNPATGDIEIDHYNIYRDGNTTLLATATTTNYQDTGLTNGQTYCYQISIVDNSSNEREKSDQKCATPTTTSNDDTITGGNGGNNHKTNTADEIVPNNPPIITEFDGTLIGSKNDELSYYAVATDPDGDDIKYEFDWADTNINTTDFMANNTRYNITQIWSSAGVYIISVRALDDYQDGKGTWSAKEYLQVVIDAHIINDPDNNVDGYLTDDEGNETYDNFHNNNDGTRSAVTKDGNYYLIDLDDDGIPDYKYDPDAESGEMTDDDTFDETPSQETDNTICYAIGILIIIVLLMLFFLLIRKKSKKK
jgi:hypothetical protein